MLEAEIQQFVNLSRQSMAFVFGKSQKKSVFESKKDIPGPGEYREAQRQVNEHSAPFNSSSFKQTEFDIMPTNTGPGTYNPRHNKELSNDKRLRMTSSFSSKVERFKIEENPVREEQSVSMKVTMHEEAKERYSRSQGPRETYGEAMSRTKTRMIAIQDANNQRKINSIGGNKEFVRIILSNPSNTQMNPSVMIDSSIVKKQNGPGSYNIEQAVQALHHKSMHVVDWSKNTAKRFKTEKNKNPGPGQYDSTLPKRSVSSNSAPFAFQGLRSYMDEVIYKTKMPFKVKVIEEKHLKDRYPGPGQYDPRLTSSKSFHYGQEAFGSMASEEAYTRKQPQQHIPGPGYYQVALANNNSSIKEEIRKTRQKIFGKNKSKPQKVATLEENHKQEMRKQCLREIESEGNKYYSLEERCTSKIGNFAQSERFKASQKQEKQPAPGPGQYRISNRSQQKFARGIQYGFNSTASRLQEEEGAKKTPFYDVDRNDMGKRALRIKRNIQNLRQIDIEKAPFNCKERRFSTHSHSEKQEEELIDMHWSIQKTEPRPEPHPRTHEYDSLPHHYKQDRNENSVFKSKSKRSWMNPPNVVGPGDYNCTSSFEKKSFNQDYHYKPPIKIRSTYRTRSSLA